MALAGKTALITGGSRGIGAAAALALAQAGARVHLTYHTNRDKAEAVVQQIRASGGAATCAALDATDPAAVKAWAAAHVRPLGQVDILFNNAGDLVQRAPLEELTPDLVRRILDLNVLSTILVTQAVLPQLPRESVIINMASAAARNGGGAGAAVYAASKGAIYSLTIGWAKELAPRGIRVFAVAPGVIDTDFHQRHRTPLAATAAASPLGKNGAVDDVARTIVYLSGEGAGFMTGTTIDINGGIWMG